MPKIGSLIVFDNLYSGLTKARWMPQLIQNTRAQSHICLIRPSLYLLDSLLQEVCILLHSSIVVLS